MPQNNPAPKLVSERTPGGELGRAFAVAFRSLRVPMVVTDPGRRDSPILVANDAFLHLTGYDRDEVIGRGWDFLHGPETNPKDVQRIREAMAAGESLEVEILSYRKSGRPFWNALAITPVEGEAGAPDCCFVVHRDISERKGLALRLAESTSRLEAEVLRRTQEAEAALERKTKLLHEVDHRVKNNLQVISSLILLKSRRIADEGAKRALQNMAERIGALSAVHRLLDPQAEAGQFDIRAFATDLAADMLSVMRPGQVELDLAAEPVGVPAAKAVPVALILNELITNAIRHAFPANRAGRLHVGTDKQDGNLRIVVADDGVGLGEELQPGAFGRTLIDMLVRQLRGRITWEDAAPGTRAVVLIPLNPEEAPT